MSELLVEKQQGVPEGWKSLKIEEVLTIRHGQSQKEVESINGPYPIFGTGGQMGWANEYLYNKPSVLIGRKGTINKPRYRDQPFWTVDTLFYSEIKTGFNEKFVYYKFCMVDWSQYNEASGVPSLNASTIEAVSALFPSHKEQTAIATALSDIDELLSSLEALIAKKQAIKTATMQQLLSGRTRLPQFALREDGSPKGYKPSELGEIPEDWEVFELKNICDSFTTGKLDANAMKVDGKYRFYTCARNFYYIDHYAFNTEALLISGNGANVGYVHYYKGKFNAYQRTYVLSEFRESIKYIKVYLEQRLVERIRVEVNAGNTPYITMGTLTDMLIALPGESKEQTAIATIVVA